MPINMAQFSLEVEEIGPRRFHICQLLHRHRSNEQQSLHQHYKYFIPQCSQIGTWQPYKASPSFYEQFPLCWSLNTSRMAGLWHLMRFKAHLGNQLIDYSHLSRRWQITIYNQLTHSVWKIISRDHHSFSSTQEWWLFQWWREDN